MFRKEWCYNGGKKHNFEARYTEISNLSPPRISRLESYHFRGNIEYMPGYSLIYLRRLYILKKYVRDVCTWCGNTVERNDNI